jgi:hypothetical protein
MHTRRQARNHIKSLERLGYKVTLQAINPAAGELAANWASRASSASTARILTSTGRRSAGSHPLSNPRSLRLAWTACAYRGRCHPRFPGPHADDGRGAAWLSRQSLPYRHISA